MGVDPVAALGLAGNIIQFVDFGCKLVRNAQSIAKSSSGSSEATRELSTIADDVKRLSQAIELFPACPERLRDVAQQCQKLAQELLHILESLQKHGKHSKWDSFLIALREIWHKDRITEFVHRLSMLQDRLTADMQFLVVDRQSAILQGITELAEENRRMNITLTQGFNSMQQAATDEIQRLRQQINGSLDAFKKPVDSAHPLEDRVLSLEDLSKALQGLQLETQDVVMKQRCLRLLYFPRMAARHTKIPEAHARTFTWSFGNNLPETGQPLHFAHWLKWGSRVFWVRGKAGSGKSTFMKFIATHPITMAYLKEWAGADELVTCRYFFWNAGSSLQKSQEGLLRTLLFELLKAAPHLIPVVQHTLKELDEAFNTPNEEERWTLPALVLSFMNVLDQWSSTRVCLFIDGLDEYKGDSDALIGLIEHISQHQHVKICASSRPWVEFLDAFGQDERHLVKLEDLTRRDIATYTKDRLSANVKFCKLKDRDNRYELLVDQVVKKAQGVFLWVYLVVRSLLEGVRYADTVEDLQLRLDAFPPDLEDFFKHMLDDVPRIYLRKTAQLFRMAAIASTPMPLMIYSFSDDLDRDPFFAINAERRSMTRAEIEKRNEELPLRLDGRSKGLLEATPIPSSSIFFRYEVDFLHRTVRDFLETSSEVQRMFESSLSERYDASQVLCNAHLAMMKLAPRYPEAEEIPMDRWEPIVEGLFHFASQAQQSTQSSDYLHDTLQQARPIFHKPGLTKFWWGVDKEVHLKIEFAALAVHTGLVNFVDTITGSLSGRFLQPLLFCALQLPWEKQTFPGSWQHSPDMVRCLIKNGADPNVRHGEGTPWTQFLWRIQTSPGFRSYTTFEVVKVLVLEGGANLLDIVPAGENLLDIVSGEEEQSKGQPDVSAHERFPEPKEPPNPYDLSDRRRMSEQKPGHTACTVLSRIAPGPLLDFLRSNAESWPKEVDIGWAEGRL